MIKHRYYRLIKASFLISAASFILLAVFVINDKLPLQEALYGAGAVFFISILFVHPYVTDLIALTHYVEKLALDRKAKMPTLSFISNIDVLSSAVQHLHTSWEGKKKQLEEIVTESELVFNTLPDSIIMVDKKQNIIRANNAALKKQGNKIIGQKIVKTIKDPLFIKDLERIIEGKKQHLNIDVSKSDKQRGEAHYVVSIEQFPVVSRNGIAAIIVMHDVTEAKRNEAMFADFVANASHEIRTPLTSIVGFIETLQTSAKDDPKAQEQFLGIMSEQAERMTNLVNDLLSLSKIERNADMQPTKAVNIKDIISNVEKQINWAAEEKNITIKKKGGRKKLPPVRGDSSELIQVVYNIVSNAIKYSPNESKITIEINETEQIPEHLRLLRGQEKAISVSVEDHGEGVDPKHIPRLTERFYRVDTARTRAEGGTGLGLAIVKHILNRHRGGIHIESTQGKGSVFTIYLPIASKKA